MARPHKLKDGRYECQNCLAKFTRNAKTYIEPLFCSDRCRKEFHATGGISLKRIESKVRQWVRDELTAIREEWAKMKEQAEFQRAADQVNRTGSYFYDLKAIAKQAKAKR